MFRLALAIALISLTIDAAGPAQAQTAADLTLAEREWLAAHKVIRIGIDPAYPPFEFIDDRGVYVGMASDYVKLIGKRLGVTFKAVPGLTWTQVVEGTKDGTVDVAPVMTPTEKRREFLNFTRSYLNFPQVIVTRKDYPPIDGMQDLAGKTVAASKGYTEVEDIGRSYPTIELHVVDNPLEELNAVATGKADATQGSLAVLSYLIEKNNLLNLHIAAPSDIPGGEMAMGVRKDWPELASIINKALATVTEKERRDIQARWVSPEGPKTTDQAGERQTDTRTLILQIGGGAVVLIVVLLVMSLLLKRFGARDSTKLYESREVKGLGMVLVGLFLTIVVLSAWFTVQSAGQRERKDVGASLRTILQTTNEALRIWVDEKKNNLLSIAEDPILRTLVEKLLSVPRNRDDLLASWQLMAVRDLLSKERERLGDIGFFVIAPDRISIGSMRDSNVGTINLIHKQKKALLDRVFLGETVLIPPILSDVPLKAEEGDSSATERTMFLAAPLRNPAGDRIVAVLTMRLDPSLDFTRIIQLGRTGQSGETYAFDNEGRLITESRFDLHLRQVGLIAEGENGILNIHIRDPGGNLLQGHPLPSDTKSLPLTVMAAEAIARRNGGNIEGYRDYRGVTVMGAWLWDDMLGVGMTTEIDVDEALASYRSTRNTILIVLAVTVLVSLALTGLSVWIGQSANRSLRRARDELELKVEERTQELATKESQLRTAMENMPGGMFMVDKDAKFVLFNNQYSELFDFPDGLIAKDAPLANMVRFQAERGDYGAGDVEELVADMTARFFSGEHAQYERRLASGAGLEINLAPTPEGGTVVVAADITERKKAEEALRESEARFQTVLDNMPVSVFLRDRDGRFVLVNRNYRKVYQITEGDVYGNSLHDLLPKEEADEFSAQDREVIQGGNAIEFETTISRGEEMQILACVKFPIRDLRGEIEAIGGVETDITERKRAEQALKESEQRLRGILRDSPIAVGIASHQGDLHFANSRFTDSYGLSPDDRQSRKVQSIYIDPAVARALYRRFQDEEAIQDEEVKLRRSDGSIGWSLVSVSPIEYKKKSAVLFWNYDITKRKHAEDALKKAFALIRESVEYASNIQRSALPSPDVLTRALGEHFVIWEPRDVVGGDIYWSRPVQDGHILAVADCTGHGVPGAFVTLIATGALQQALAEHPDGDPAKLIARMNRFVKSALRQDLDEGQADDGLELGVCRISERSGRVTYAGARFSLWMLPDGAVEEIKGEKAGIGYRRAPMDFEITNHKLTVTPDTVLYMVSDGITDQIGGEKQRSFGKKRLAKLFQDHRGLPMEEQKTRFLDAFQAYQGDQLRRDDVTMIGFRPSS